MPTLKREHCVTDTTALLYDIAITLEKILAAVTPATPLAQEEKRRVPLRHPAAPAAEPKGEAQQRTHRQNRR